MRKRANSGEQHGFAYAHTAFASDSAIRYWYFASDSAFAYHPDSGLRTFSGRLLGWESNVSHKLEQQNLDSVSSYQHNAKESTRHSASNCLLRYAIFLLLLVIFVIAYRVIKR